MRRAAFLLSIRRAIPVLAAIGILAARCWSADLIEEPGVLIARLKKVVISGAAQGKKPSVFIDLFGKNTRVKIVGASDKGVTVLVSENELPLTWKDFNPEQFGATASEFAATGTDALDVVRYYVMNKMSEKAEKASSLALQLDKSIAPQVSAVLALLPARNVAAPKPAENPNTGNVSRPPVSNTYTLPDDRRIDWKPGVPGGIPNYPVFASAKDPTFGAKGDGQADDTAAIQRAIDACSVGKAVLLPAGTYRLTAMLKLNKGVVLRGEGPEKTRLLNEASANHIIMMGSRDSDVKGRILSGYTKGSTSIVVEEPAKFKTGDLILIDQLNDPDLVDIQGCGGACTWAGRDDGKRAMGQLVRVTAKDGPRLGLSRPLYFTFKEALQPEADRIDRPVVNAGVEDLYMEMKATKRSDSSSPIRIEHGIHCWVKNVESYRGWFAGHVSIQTSLGCEIRDCYFHHTHTFGGGYGYGIWIFAESTDTLVENNICHYLHCGIMIESGGCGNVISYNYCSRMFGRDYPATDWAHADIGLHGAHPYMNLLEGNYVSTIGFDFYWGSSSHNTLFRNYTDMDCRMVNGQPMMAVIAVRLDQRNYFTNVLGNVFGSEGMKGIIEAAAPNYGQKMVWRLGYKTPSGGGAADDPKTAQTLLRHGNLDFISKQIHWDPTIQNQKLPNSLYLTAKPAFFGSSPWPAMGPDATPVYSSIPARERFLKMPKVEP